jgi:hypothetical protein
MEQNQKEESRNHVIQKIKRISNQIDRRDFWIYLEVFVLVGLIVAAVAYYFFL